MVNIKSISNQAHYVGVVTTDTINTVATNPSAIKKVAQIAMNLFKAKDLYFIGAFQDRTVTDGMKFAVEGIEFYGTFKNLVFWINPFSKETLDEEVLKKSLIDNMSDPMNLGKDEKRESDAIAIFNAVQEETAKIDKKEYSKNKIRDVIKEHLKTSLKSSNKGLDDLVAERKAQEIADKVVLQQKSRSIVLLFTTACYTFLDASSNILALKKWGIADLTVIVAEIGTKSQVFAFVMKLNPGTVFGTVASAALIVTFGDAAKKLWDAYDKYQAASSGKEKEAAWTLLRKALLDTVSSGVDLLNTVTPLLFSVNPPLLVSFAIIAKGTGLVIMLIK